MSQTRATNICYSPRNLFRLPWSPCGSYLVYRPNRSSYRTLAIVAVALTDPVKKELAVKSQTGHRSRLRASRAVWK